MCSCLNLELKSDENFFWGNRREWKYERILRVVVSVKGCTNVITVVPFGIHRLLHFFKQRNLVEWKNKNYEAVDKHFNKFFFSESSR